MATLVLLPQLGISEESAVLTEWRVQTGDAVKAGDVLFSLETGKSAFDVESEYTGTVLALLVSEGDEVPVKTPVCAIGEAGEQFTMNNEPIPEPAKPVIETAHETQSGFANGSLLMVSCQGASPRAKKLALKNDVDPLLTVPSGPDGRVIERDVRQFIDTGAESQQSNAVSYAYEDKPLSVIRRTIAKTMTASLRNAAQLTHTASFDATELQKTRKTLKANPVTAGVTLNDMILFAVTRTLPAFPALNAWILENNVMRAFKDVHLACAVDTEKGLMVPVIFNASGKTLPDISNELKTLAEGCRNGTIAPDLLTGGSFTVSNLGAFGIESFTPILNPPQTGILGVCGISQRVRTIDGCIGVYPAMTLSLTYDHRAVDGAPASRFLQALCNNLENFTEMMK